MRRGGIRRARTRSGSHQERSEPCAAGNGAPAWGGEILGKAPSDDPDEECEGQLQRYPEPQHRGREQERKLARVDQPLEMLLGYEGNNREGRERSGRVTTRARVEREADERERREDEDDLRRVGEIPVQIVRRHAQSPIRDCMTEQHACSGERQHHEPGQRSAHVLMMPGTAVDRGFPHRLFKKGLRQRFGFVRLGTFRPCTPAAC